ncbi:hypothetical protein PAT3040_01757 [Paenibacillus agaridevorans]|uniref:Peptidase M56 BlaR1 n=1 Tax=Paenibacillus agaridevorans TaxID=171404 RepID=A0A2R5ENH4_9BACL|nr:hypothetical protein [Paenibacillus agaridevorans]GBG07209.1 hypothetical protein PAT3040_01757 [Paenibacillus agaridevorans]
MDYSRGLKLLIGAVIFVSVGVGGAVAYQNVYAKSATTQSSVSPQTYSLNESGQTYGSAGDTIPDEMLPDLIHGGSVDGLAGYVLKSDYLKGGTDVPLYDVEGKNIIGSIHIAGAKSLDFYPENENGQTYGSDADATSPETRPDLIRAIGEDGIEGYVLKKDLDGELPKTPEEAIAKQNSRSPGGRDIPLYDVDGETVIGVFHVG